MCTNITGEEERIIPMSMNKVYYPMTDNNMRGLAKILKGERSEMFRTTEYMQAE